jgi:hypothetical protein
MSGIIWQEMRPLKQEYAQSLKTTTFFESIRLYAITHVIDMKTSFIYCVALQEENIKC